MLNARFLLISTSCTILAAALVGGATSDERRGPISLGYELRFVDTTIHPLAVCNDGSPAAYYLHKGTDNGWVFHQQGGWWCWDEYSCQVRWDRSVLSAALG